MRRQGGLPDRPNRQRGQCWACLEPRPRAGPVGRPPPRGEGCERPSSRAGIAERPQAPANQAEAGPGAPPTRPRSRWEGSTSPSEDTSSHAGPPRSAGPARPRPSVLSSNRDGPVRTPHAARGAATCLGPRRDKLRGPGCIPPTNGRGTPPGAGREADKPSGDQPPVPPRVFAARHRSQVVATRLRCRSAPS